MRTIVQHDRTESNPPIYFPLKIPPQFFGGDKSESLILEFRRIYLTQRERDDFLIAI